jgi:hypothetical protein
LFSFTIKVYQKRAFFHTLKRIVFPKKKDVGVPVLCRTGRGCPPGTMACRCSLSLSFSLSFPFRAQAGNPAEETAYLCTLTHQLRVLQKPLQINVLFEWIFFKLMPHGNPTYTRIN